eukprot:CAMPEP_0206140554 /NCGR_PEP_ID=MMETSP1473-20131121/9751_1 /ASSEMBLY_ACC=CAM_ASM_001109 /TAXON_ID=1461547 /ORGANISM="Stichococcus sp, Strain RCC1054" /LENGTH=330 /DNA_ID=CAMNT_0053534731 /DNA_START=120 /DNA_END=1112 /DNA_ORIENTATION=+
MSAPRIPSKKLFEDAPPIGAVGMGSSQFGHAYGSPDDKKAMAAIKLAFDNGVNFFDVAPFYGAGDAERLLGRGLQQLPRDQIFVGTKVGKYKPGEPEDFSAERVKRSVRESLDRLQLSYLDLVHCHDIESAVDMQQIIKETIPALQELKKEGLIRHIGITGLPLDIYTYILDRVPVGTIDAILSYCHNNLADNTLTSLLDYFHEKKVVVISASFSSMGLLTSRDPPSWHPAAPEVKEAAVKSKNMCKEKGTDLARIAIKHFVNTKGVDIHLFGMATPDEVEEDLKIVREAWGLIPDEKADTDNAVWDEIKQVFEPVKDKTWPTGRQNNRT